MPFTHNHAKAVTGTCLAVITMVHCIERCLILSPQGRDELGDHAGGPSEKDHEQHTDNESPDAAPPRHGDPGVTDGIGRAQNPKGQQKQNLSGAVPGT